MKISELREKGNFKGIIPKRRIPLVEKFKLATEFREDCLQESDNTMYFEMMAYKLKTITTLANDYLGIEFDEEDLYESIEFLFSDEKFKSLYAEVQNSDDWAELMDMISMEMDKYMETYNSVGAVLARFLVVTHEDDEVKKFNEITTSIKDMLDNMDMDKLIFLKEISSKIGIGGPLDE